MSSSRIGTANFLRSSIFIYQITHLPYLCLLEHRIQCLLLFSLYRLLLSPLLFLQLSNRLFLHPLHFFLLQLAQLHLLQSPLNPFSLLYLQELSLLIPLFLVHFQAFLNLLRAHFMLLMFPLLHQLPLSSELIHQQLRLLFVLFVVEDFLGPPFPLQIL